MVLSNGAGIPAPSEVSMFALANTSSYERGGDGDSSSTAGRRPEDIVQRADERKPLFAQANYELLVKSEAVVWASKQRAKSDLRMVGGVRFRSKERSDVARK